MFTFFRFPLFHLPVGKAVAVQTNAGEATRIPSGASLGQLCGCSRERERERVPRCVDCPGGQGGRADCRHTRDASLLPSEGVPGVA